MSIENDIARVYALERQAKALASDLGCKVCVDVMPDDNDPNEFNTWSYVGDYTHYAFNKMPTHWSYTTKDTPIIHAEPEDIVSFTKPPQEKSPAADQSKQGMSVDEIAQRHLTLSEGKEKEDVFINI